MAEYIIYFIINSI